MIRLFPTTARWLVTALRAYQGIGANDVDVYRFHRDRMGDRADMDNGPSPEDRAVLFPLERDLEDGNIVPEFNLETDVIAPLVRQLGQAEPDDQTLINRIVEILQLPYARNRITTTMLNSLREAVLNADEVAKFNTLVAVKEMECTGCNHMFKLSEAVSFASGGRGGELKLYCRNCWRPQYKACRQHNCNNVVSIGDLGETAYCPEHGGAAVEQQQQWVTAAPAIEQVVRRFYLNDTPTPAAVENFRRNR